MSLLRGCSSCLFPPGGARVIISGTTLITPGCYRPAFFSSGNYINNINRDGTYDITGPDGSGSQCAKTTLFSSSISTYTNASCSSAGSSGFFYGRVILSALLMRVKIYYSVGAPDFYDYFVGTYAGLEVWDGSLLSLTRESSTKDLTTGGTMTIEGL